MPGGEPRDELPTSPFGWTPEQLREAAAKLKERAYEMLHMARDLEGVADALEGKAAPALPAGDKSGGGPPHEEG